MKKFNRNGYLKATLVLAMLFIFTSFSTKKEAESDTNNLEEKRYYQLVFVRIKDNAKYGEYISKLTPVVMKYGGRAERVIRVSSYFDSHKGEKNQEPHMINIVSYNSKQAFEKFEKDPEFMKLEELRNQAIEIAGINGFTKAENLINEDTSQRLYMVEFVNYKSKSDYNKYLKKAKNLYERYGHHTERTLKPDSYFGNLKEKPNLVNIMYFDNEEGKKNMHSDKDHKKVEDYYASAVNGLIWVEGKSLAL